MQIIYFRETLFVAMEVFIKCMYLFDKVSLMAVSAVTLFGLLWYLECGKLLCRKTVPLILLRTFMSYVRPAIQYSHKAWCLRKNANCILRTE